MKRKYWIWKDAKIYNEKELEWTCEVNEAFNKYRKGRVSSNYISEYGIEESSHDILKWHKEHSTW